MPKILFFNVPTSGHVNATYPVVKALVQRGVEVVYYLTENYRKPVEATGATFRAYNNNTITDTYFESHGLDGSHPLQTAAVLIETCREILPELIEITRAEKPDIIMHDSMCPWGWQIAQLLGIKSVSSMSLLGLTPTILLKSGLFFGMVRNTLPDLPYLFRFQRSAGELKRTMGLKTPSFVDFMNTYGTITVSYTSRLFQPEGDSFPQSVRFVGPQIEPRPHDTVFPFDQLDSTKPLVYISLGTVIYHNLDFFREAIKAFSGTPYQVVMAIGKKTDLSALGSIPDNFIVRGFVPQLEILQRTAAFVTHAGMNSVQEGLYYDVLLALVPQQDEQRLVAGRVESLGAGLMFKTPTVPADQLRAAVERLINEPAFKQNAVKVGQSLRDAGGIERAANEILSLLN